jgi:hypothetical protein
MKTLLATTAIILTASFAAPVFASGDGNSDDTRCGQSDRATWMGIEAITAKAKSLGYSIREVEESHGCYEVSGDKDGARVEAYFHPVSGELVKTEMDDDDSDSDGDSGKRGSDDN